MIPVPAPKRAALFAGSLAAAAILAATASSAVVNLLYPSKAVPARIALATPQPLRPVALPPQPVPASAPASIDVATLPTADTAGSPADIVPLPDAEPVLAALDPAPADPAVQNSEPRPTSDVLPERTAALQGDGTTSTAAAPSVIPVRVPEMAVAAEAPALLRPAPRPAAPATAVIAQALAVPAPSVPGLRPMPRPANLVIATYAPNDNTAAPAQLIEAGFSIPRANASPFAGSGSGSCNRSLARAIPRRSASAPTGTAFLKGLGGLSGPERDAAVIKELARGDVPSFLRNLKPVTFRGTDAKGQKIEITICVSPDYLALGSDRDFVRVPLGLPAAAAIARKFNMTLPTPHMVDAIYKQADVHLAPAPMQAGPRMTSTAYILRHNATIQSQLKGRGGLIAGQKKDVVMANRLASAPGRVAIYGWHRTSGRPIQPVSTVHGKNYADYSHGIRLVSRTAYLNGRAVDIDDLLSSGRYAAMLNTGGPLPAPVIRIASR